MDGKRFHSQRRSAIPTDVLSPRGMSVWIPVEAAPFNRALQICVVEGEGVQAFGFRCQRVEDGWKVSIPMNFSICSRRIGAIGEGDRADL